MTPAFAENILPISKLFEFAVRSPDLPTAVTSLEKSLRNPEAIKFQERYPIWQGFAEISDSFNVSPEEFHSLEKPMARLYQVLLDRHKDQVLYGYDLSTLVRSQPGRNFAAVLKQFGPRTKFRFADRYNHTGESKARPSQIILEYLKSERVPPKMLLQAFEWTALADGGAKKFRGESTIGPEVDQLVDTLPKSLRMEAARRIQYDIEWHVDGEEQYFAVAPDTTLKWIRRAFTELSEEQAFFYTVDLLSRMGGFFDNWAAPEPRTRTDEFQPDRLPVSFQLQLIQAIPHARIVPLYQVLARRIELDGISSDDDAEITQLIVAARKAGAGADDLAALEMILNNLPEPGASERPKPGVVDALRKFAGWKVGKKVTDQESEGEFRLVFRENDYNFSGSNCTAKYDLSTFRSGNWRDVAVVKASCRSKTEFKIQFRLGWKLRRLVQ